MSQSPSNTYLDGPLPALFLRTALPIIFVMSMNGLLTVADALFLGHYVGQQALAAVTLMFPPYMLIVALATLVASGMSSGLARHLGAGRMGDARRLYASAHWLALSVGAALILLYAGLGPRAVMLAADGNAGLADMADTYLRILVIAAPLTFVLSVNSDALRNEGRVGVMAGLSLLVSLANIGFNYLLIAQLQLGVAGSAYGTVLAQVVALILLLVYRSRGNTALHPRDVVRNVTASGWRGILALGAPQSLGFIGVALGSTAILTALQLARAPDYAVTVSAYGIVTRVLTFAILPLIGLSQAMQSITGNNHGAGQVARADASLKVAVGAAFLFCLAVQLGLTLSAPVVGAGFVSDPEVVAKVATILPMMVALFLLTGPLMMIGAHFQAIGDAPRAAILGLAKPYLFAIPLTFALPLAFGGDAIWWAGPMAEASLLTLTIMVLFRNARRTDLRFGLFANAKEVRL